MDRTRLFPDRYIASTDIGAMLLAPLGARGKKKGCSGLWTTVTPTCKFKSDAFKARMIVSHATNRPPSEAYLATSSRLLAV